MHGTLCCLMQCRLLYIACSTCIGVVPHSDPLPDYYPAPPNLGLGVWVELLLGSQISTLFHSIRLYFILKITKQKKNIIQRVRHFLNASPAYCSTLSPNTSTRKFQNGIFIVEEREGKGACLMTQSLFLPSIMGK